MTTEFKEATMPNGIVTHVTPGDTMKLIPIIILGLLLSACTLMNVKTEITAPDGKVWEISSKSDAVVSIKTKDTEIVVDNKGRMSVFESILGIAMTNTDINLGLSNKPQEVD